MPLYKTINKESNIGIWKISETVEELELLIDLNSNDKIKFDQFLTSKRKKEWLATRILIQELLANKAIHIIYDKHQKPVLSNSYYVSISHTNGFVAVIINDKKEVGIDIQVEKKNIEKGAYSFMNELEIEQLGVENKLQKTHLYWCAKEALYKYIGDSSLNIYTHFSILDFNLADEGSLVGKVNDTDENVLLSYFIFHDFYLVWTC